MAIVFAVGTYFVLRHFLMFATSFVGAYIIFLGIDCLARKGYIAAFERILNGNANSRVEYTVSNIVYVFLAMTLLLSLVSFGFQTWFNAKFDIVLVPAKPKEEPAKEEPAKKEESQGEGGGDGGSGSGDGGGDGDGEEEAGGDQEQAPSEKTKSKAPSAAPSAASTAASPSPPPAPAPPGPPPGTATTIHTTSARFIISPD
jgi:uncharacterized membrane protein YgcG